MHEILALQPPVSWARTETDAPRRAPLRVGVVQHRWHEDPAATEAELEEGIRRAAARGAAVVFLPELTLSRYPADTLPDYTPSSIAEDLETGRTLAFARRAAAAHGLCVHASLYRKGAAGGPLGYNTAILVAPDGRLLAATDKLHIPVTEGYYEDRFFRPGPEAGSPYPVHSPPSSAGPASACRRAGTNGSPSSPAPTRSRARRSSPTRRRSAPSPATPTSTPSPCGGR
ncbi:nitrilase-related carbon-nitrogen hydrolase [Sinomonas atrocyanea]